MKHSFALKTKQLFQRFKHICAAHLFTFSFLWFDVFDETVLHTHRRERKLTGLFEARFLRAGLAKWREQSPSTNVVRVRFPVPPSYVDWVSLCYERYFPGYSGFLLSLKTNIWFDLLPQLVKPLCSAKSIETSMKWSLPILLFVARFNLTQRSAMFLDFATMLRNETKNKNLKKQVQRPHFFHLRFPAFQGTSTD